MAAAANGGREAVIYANHILEMPRGENFAQCERSTRGICLCSIVSFAMFDRNLGERIQMA